MIPLRVTNFKNAEGWPNSIIIHHTAEFSGETPAFAFDTQKFQSDKYMNFSYRKLKFKETRYNYIIEHIDTDWHVIVSQPILTKCVYPDLDDEFNNSIHLAFLGDYDKDIPPIRMYKVACYRVIAPIARLFYIDEDRIFLHREISNDSKITCPGEFVDKSKLLNQLRSVRKKTSLRRS